MKFYLYMLLNTLRDFVRSKAKAIAAFVVAAAVSYLAKHGFTVAPDLNDVLVAVVAGLINAIAVYRVPNKP